MKASRSFVTLGLTLATSSVLAACASSGRTTSTSETPQTAPTQAGAAGVGRRDAFVLTAAEIAAAPGVQNAFDAVQQLRPHFLRTRGAVTATGGGLLGGGGNRPTGRTGTQGQSQGLGTRPSGSAPAADSDRGLPSTSEDVGIMVYVDRQRYGRIQTLREIPAVAIDEIRFLNVGEANSQFGMGHPHGVIQIITRRGPADR